MKGPKAGFDAADQPIRHAIRRPAPGRHSARRNRRASASGVMADRRAFPWFPLVHVATLLSAVVLCVLRADVASTMLLVVSVLCLILTRVEALVEVDNRQAEDSNEPTYRTQDPLATLSQRQALFAALLLRTATLDMTEREAWIERCAALAQRLDTPGSDADRELQAMRDEIS